MADNFGGAAGIASAAGAQQETQLCRLCTLPVRAPIYDKQLGETEVFCCSGCRNVWRILVESGKLANLSDPRDSPIYRQALAAGIIGPQSDISAAVRPRPLPGKVIPEQKGGTIDDNRQCVLQINGMWCSSCAWLIEHTLLKRRGVVGAEVSFSSDTARVTYKPAKTDETDIAKVVDSLGYSAIPLGESNNSDPQVINKRRDLLRVVIAIAFAMNVMMTQLILYAGFFEGISKDMRSGLPWLLLALSAPVIAASSPIFYRAYKAALNGVATMETLVSLGAAAAFGYSLWQTFAGTGHVYYDTADMLLGLVMVGKYIERGARRNANDALTLLYGLLPKKATIIRDGVEYPVALPHLADGDLIIVKAGERIAADGAIESGSGIVDESLLSGESRPINKRTGDPAIEGTVLMDGVLTVRVVRVGDTGTLNQIIKHVQDALSAKTPAEKMADQISRVFVPIVLCLALGTGLFLALASHAGADTIMTRIVSVLVIACPCALGIATPMAVSAGVSSAARAGILIADGGAFETLRQITCVVLDKTGTATEGIFEVNRQIGSDDQTYLLSALESKSSHPIASAITRHFKTAASPRGDAAEFEAESSPPIEVTDFAINEGIGVSAMVDGNPVFAGNGKAVTAAGLSLSNEQRFFTTECSRDGMTIIYWGIANDKVIGAVALGDRVRGDAVEAINALAALGIDTQMLSGDSAAATSYIAGQLAITTYRGDVSPKEKADIVQHLRQTGKKVCMVGDGVNDAPALAQADVGIALASGTDIAARTAQVTLLKPDLLLLPKLIRLSRRTVSTMHKNLFWAFLYNTISIPLAMLGHITPLWAAAAMLASSLTVIINTKRLLR
jgi:heavy metal translocating P-type ATPase